MSTAVNLKSEITSASAGAAVETVRDLLDNGFIFASGDVCVVPFNVYEQSDMYSRQPPENYFHLYEDNEIIVPREYRKLIPVLINSRFIEGSDTMITVYSSNIVSKRLRIGRLGKADIMEGFILNVYNEYRDETYHIVYDVSPCKYIPVELLQTMELHNFSVKFKLRVAQIKVSDGNGNHGLVYTDDGYRQKHYITNFILSLTARQRASRYPEGSFEKVLLDITDKLQTKEV